MTAYSFGEIFTSVARIGVVLSVGSMFITGFLHGDLLAFAGAGLQYWFMQPVFWNILQVGESGGVGAWAAKALLVNFKWWRGLARYILEVLVGASSQPGLR